MNKNSMRKLLSFILCIVLIAAMALLATGCTDNKKETPETPKTPDTNKATTAPTQKPEATDATQGVLEEVPTDVTVKGEGNTKFYLDVVNTDKTLTKFEIHTYKKTVGEALLELELITGDSSDYGLYITSVNGITADWDTEKAYWAFYIGDDYAQTGVDATDITADAVYSFVKTVSE